MIREGLIGGEKYQFELGYPLLNIYFEKNVRGRCAMVIHIVRMTQFPNIVWLRLITFHLGYPWFRRIAVLTDVNDL